jgi:DNA-binding IclR family transcriptional regulator
MEEQDDESPIKSVRKAIGILDALSDARRALRVGEIASKLNMSVSAVSRLVATLSKGALVQQDEETGRCYLGLGLTVLGANALGRRAIDRIAMPIMDELANRIRGYVSLSRLARGKVVLMRALPSPLSQHGVNLVVAAPVHACAPGKILCGGLTTAEILALIKSQGMDVTMIIGPPHSSRRRRRATACDRDGSRPTGIAMAAHFRSPLGALLPVAALPAADFQWSELGSRPWPWMPDSRELWLRQGRRGQSRGVAARPLT